VDRGGVVSAVTRAAMIFQTIFACWGQIRDGIVSSTEKGTDLDFLSIMNDIMIMRQARETGSTGSITITRLITRLS
jgi:hypothetical protein